MKERFIAEIPAMPIEIIKRLNLKPSEHFFGTSFRFNIIIYGYMDDIVCGMMDETGGPGDKIIFVRRNYQKYLKMTRTFAETADVGIIERIVKESLNNGNKHTKIKT